MYRISHIKYVVTLFKKFKCYDIIYLIGPYLKSVEDFDSKFVSPSSIKFLIL
jgi:hypothetical protein